MELNNKISAVLVIFLLAFLVVLHFAAEDESAGNQDSETTEGIVSVGQSIDLIIMNDDIILEKDNIKLLEEISITITIRNTGTSQAPNILVVTYLERNGFRTEIHNQTTSINANEEEDFPYKFIIPADLEPGNYNLVVSANVQLIGNDQDLSNNEASRPITIKPIDLLDFSIQGNFTYPGKAREIVVELNNKNNVQLNTTLNLYYYTSSGNKSDSIGIGTLDLEVDRLDSKSANFTWNVSNDIKPGEYIVWVEITDASDTNFIGASASVTYKILEIPDRSTTPVYLQMWFIVGLIALIIFFLTIILSLIGVIPQDRLPIQPALVVMALVIMIIALIGNYFDPSVHLIGPQDIAGMVIIHPITALTAGFLVAGGLEAAGAFTAAADALGRIEKLQFRGKTIFGFTGTVVILTNIPTLIAMPCGRILGAALMPAALFFGYRVAKSTGDSRMVGVVVFAFIVNAAASCGPSPLGGIGTIGEGMSKMPIGSFTAAQSTGIMICTGVCALFMRFVTPMSPADLSDEDIKREAEAEKKAVADTMGDAQNDPKENGDIDSKPDEKTSVKNDAKKNKPDKDKKNLRLDMNLMNW